MSHVERQVATGSYERPSACLATSSPSGVFAMPQHGTIRGLEWLTADQIAVVSGDRIRSPVRTEL
jgi:hypothetical protein